MTTSRSNDTMLTGAELDRLRGLARQVCLKARGTAPASVRETRQIYNYTQKIINTLNKAERREKRQKAKQTQP